MGVVGLQVEAAVVKHRRGYGGDADDNELAWMKRGTNYSNTKF